MGCCGSSQTEEINVNETLEIYGDYVNTETRTIRSILEFARVQYKFKPVLKTNEGSMELQKYKSNINATGSIPTICHNNNTVVGGNNLHLIYISRAIRQVRDRLAP